MNETLSKTQFIRGVLAWFCGTIFVTYAFTVTTSFALFTDTLTQQLHITSGQYNMASGIYTLVFGVMQIPAGYLVQNFNARMIVSIAIAIFLVGIFAFSSTSNYMMLCISNVIMAFGAAFAFVSTATLINQWFSIKLFPIFLGLTQAISVILSSFLHEAFVYFLNTNSWQSILQFSDAVGLIVLVLSILFVCNPPKSQSAGEIKSDSISLWASVIAVLKSPLAWIIGLAAAFSFGSMLGYSSFWSIISIQTRGATHYTAVSITGWAFWGIGLGTPFFGWLSNYLKQRMRLIIQMTCLTILVILLSIYLPRYNFTSGNTNAPAAILMFLTGFFGASTMLYYTVAVESIAEKLSGAILGFVNMLVFVFQSVVFLIPYAIMVGATTSTYYNFLWIIPFFIVISIMLGLLLKDPLTHKKAIS